MQIKKYIASTLKEASGKMKAELGEKSIVLSTRIIENDPKYGNVKMFEITAGAEDDYDAHEKPAPAKVKPEAEKPVSSFAEELRKIQEKLASTQPAEMAKGKIPSPGYEKPKQKSVKADNEAIERELDEIKDTLAHREIQSRLADSIIDDLKKYRDFLQPSNIDSYVVSTISSMIQTRNFEVEKTGSPKVISLIGPTGVGKTTCIAKLAIISKILHNLNIGLISVDTYRLGAIDQLKIFSEISNIEMRVAYEEADIAQFLKDFKNKDLVFLDTAGRSQNNTASLAENKRYLKASGATEVYLVLSATTTTRTMFDMAEKFKAVGYNGIIFTKLDEAVSYGNILNVVAGYNVPVTYLTNGQVIPDDIIAADSDFLANMIYTGKLTK